MKDPQQYRHSREHVSPQTPTTTTATTTSLCSSKAPQQHSSRNRSTKRDLDHMLAFIHEPPNLLDPSDLNPSTPLDCDTMDLIHCIVKAADGRKASDICALQVRHITSLTSALVIVSGTSRPQNQAIAAAITDDVELQFGQQPGGNGIPEGSAESGWMLLDYGSVMVHIMTPKSRLFYNVQGQWMQKGGRSMDLTDILIPNTVVGGGDSWTAGGAPPTTGEPAEEEDPFWS